MSRAGDPRPRPCVKTKTKTATTRVRFAGGLGGFNPPPLVVDDPLTGDRQFWSGGSASTPLPAAARSRWHGGSFHSRFDRPNRLLYIVRIEAGVRL